MLLRRLAYPTRLSDVEMQFGWERSRFSRITQQTAMYIWTRWKHLLRFDPTRLTREKLAFFARVFKAKGSPLDFIVGLIDGTLQENARPVRNQRLVYNGWKRMHCLKYHAVVAPDGLVIHVYGPVDGRRHDETVFKESGLSELLNKHFWTPDGEPLFIYGDPAYSVGPHIMCPYKRASLTPQQQAFNTAMSRIREPIEWLFKEVAQQFTFIDFERSQNFLLSPCGLYYLVSLLMCNAHTILHYPQIPQYFACPPPSLQEYFTGGPIEDSELDAWCLDSMWEEVEENTDVEMGNVMESEGEEDYKEEDMLYSE
ncbi:hypothetical protein M422DRAFT_169591 [Sphaerobolus stellatus SS14]|uniref:DDE Tnp4 domain-containing protein n=1 Tax=Sphaerobolus stellatus (strain SS14) TaxID=990650 RepID=A0A0C9VXN2_SPHS4|nr:hypothetical protein M422DRAFT_169591 [Sphaerobolus stellatus SS14]